MFLLGYNEPCALSQLNEGVLLILLMRSHGGGEEVIREEKKTRDNRYDTKHSCHAATHYYYLTTREFKYKEQKTADVRGVSNCDVPSEAIS